MDRAQLRSIGDALRNKWKTGVVVLASADGSTVSIITAVTQNLTSKVHAGQTPRVLWHRPVGGKGGGRPDMAEGGGKKRGGFARRAGGRVFEGGGDALRWNNSTRWWLALGRRSRLRHRVAAAA